ncbi:cilia- and flagella-associated protein 221 isoform X2 [Xyrichtys novacula]|uniref:Cilia- and flagella-associated protein 221 isoform X2 n=1 Tax=Xyrichtys novacula TaxID=13765 RepID=A0AAV1HLW5_XYRNO|nr:cilia- and flagella-associated protein 221 isoform X2 [Xyrichtys novacula]
MEMPLSTAQILPEQSRRGTPLPQLVEERRSQSNIPNYLLDTKKYVKLKSNSLVQVEPPDLHFSGFELEKDYTKMLKVMNISPEVTDVHIIPTQTKHFKTTYTKKHRLIPGLAYTVKIKFCPDEWGYFYDCVRIHCKGEENLLVPIYAYPVINDLHIPAQINLPAVPLGQSISHAIPLRCSCPIDFEFQVLVLQPHEAFSIHPLSGVIPTNGEEKITVTFSPFQYETSQITIQLIISQFNSKPHLCTIRGKSVPNQASGERGRKAGNEDAAVVTSTKVQRLQTKERSAKLREKSKPPVDVCTHAGSIPDSDNSSSKDLGRAKSSGSLVDLLNKKTKSDALLKKFRLNEEKLKDTQLRGRAHLGDYPLLEGTRKQIEEGETALPNFVSCEGVLTSSFLSSLRRELGQRRLTLFQKAAHKINHRPTSLKNLSDRMKSLLLAETSFDHPVTSSLRSEQDKNEDLEISPDRVFPFSFHTSSRESNLLTSRDTLPVGTPDVTVTTQIPSFILQVPQHFKLMGYRPVSAREAFDSYSYVSGPCTQQLRTGALTDRSAQFPTEVELKARDEKEDVLAISNLSFKFPETLLRRPPEKSLRIFNPAPGLHNFRTTPKYLETDLDFHLCPVPRYRIPGSKTCPQTLQTQKLLDFKKEANSGVLKTWSNFSPVISTCLSKRSKLNCRRPPRRSVSCSTDVLTEPPPLLTGPAGDWSPGMHDELCEEEPRIQLTPEMVRAVFLSGGSSGADLTGGGTMRPGTKLPVDPLRWSSTECRSEFNQTGRRVMARLKQLSVTDRNPSQLREDGGEKASNVD